MGRHIGSCGPLNRNFPKLYVARAKFDNGLFVGKAGSHLSRGCCIGYNGREYELDTFQVLVHD
ncbi:DM9 repeat-containing protein [Enterobacter hormaechei]|uniref:DM9 repeat-containing protein n=1 Tax=Enterobacter hormaechei TaxID=158836 RepID=UPI00388D371D